MTIQHSPRPEAQTAMTHTPFPTPIRRTVSGVRMLSVLAAFMPLAAGAQDQQSLARTAIAPAALSAPSPQTVNPYAASPYAVTVLPTVTAPATAPQTSPAPTMVPAATAQPVALQSRSFAPTEAPRAPHVSRQSSTALMIVGFAAMIVGAVVDGDAGTLIMVGGAGVGLYGLYHYLN